MDAMTQIEEIVMRGYLLAGLIQLGQTLSRDELGFGVEVFRSIGVEGLIAQRLIDIQLKRWPVR